MPFAKRPDSAAQPAITKPAVPTFASISGFRSAAWLIWSKRVDLTHRSIGPKSRSGPRPFGRRALSLQISSIRCFRALWRIARTRAVLDRNADTIAISPRPFAATNWPFATVPRRWPTRNGYHRDGRKCGPWGGCTPASLQSSAMMVIACARGRALRRSGPSFASALSGRLVPPVLIYRRKEQLPCPAPPGYAP